MSEKRTGVYPCYENQFNAGDSAEAANPIADMESFSVSLDNGVEEWSTYSGGGWKNRLMTAKAITVSAKGKRNIGDKGNDYVAGKFMANGRDAEGYFCWTFPDGSKLEFNNAVFNITALGAADATNVAPLEFDVMSNGKPTYTPAL